MSAELFPDTDAEIASIEPDDLKARIDGGESVFIVDARAANEFEKWHIDGENVRIENVPYFEFIDDEIDESLFEPLPEDELITVLCAKGGASEYIASVLDEHGYEVEHLENGMNGWASIYEYVEIDADTDATVAQYQRPSSGCLAYLIVDGDEAAVIDPLRAFTDEYVKDARVMGADLVYAIDTHVHADHISGIRALAAEADAMPVLPEASVARGVDYDVEFETVADGDELTVGETTIEVVYTPGHTSGMTAYKVGNVLFTGDGLFTESVARPDLEEGDDGAPEAAAQLYETLQTKVLSLDDETIIAPAHFSDAASPAADGTYTAALGELRETMGALSMSEDEFVEFILSDMPPRPANYEEIIATNLGVNDADDDEAFRLELGPNNCAASQDALTGD